MNIKNSGSVPVSGPAVQTTGKKNTEPKKTDMVAASAPLPTYNPLAELRSGLSIQDANAPMNLDVIAECLADDNTFDDRVSQILTLARESENKIPLATNPGVLAGLIKSMNSDNPQMANVSLRIMEDLAAAPENKISLWNNSAVVAAVTKCLNSDLPETASAAIAVIFELSVAPENKISLAENDAVMAGLLKALKSDSAMDFARSLATLENLASADENKVFFARNDCLMASLSDALVSGFDLGRGAARLVSLLDNGRVMSGLINGMNSDLPETVVYSLTGIERLAEVPGNKISLAQNTTVMDGLINGLHSDLPAVVEKAVLAIGHLAVAPENRVSFAQDSRLMDGVIKALRSDNATTVYYATGVIANLEEAPENRLFLAQDESLVKGLFDALDVVFLRKSGPSFVAKKVLSSLARSSESSVPLAQNTAMMYGLVNGMNSDNPDTATFALNAIGNLARTAENRVSLAENGGVLSGLLKCLNSDRPETVETSIVAIGYLSGPVENRFPMAEFPGLMLGLTGATYSDRKGTRNMATSVIANLSVPKKLDLTIGLNGVIVRLLKSLGSIRSQGFAKLLVDISGKTIGNRGPKFLGRIPGLFNAVSALENSGIRDHLMHRIDWTDRSWDHSDPTATREMADAFHTHFLSKQQDVRAFEANMDSTSSQGLGDTLVGNSLSASYLAYLELTNAKPLSGVTYSPFLGG